MTQVGEAYVVVGEERLSGPLQDHLAHTRLLWVGGVEAEAQTQLR